MHIRNNKKEEITSKVSTYDDAFGGHVFHFSTRGREARAHDISS